MTRLEQALLELNWSVSEVKRWDKITPLSVFKSPGSDYPDQWGELPERRASLRETCVTINVPALPRH